MPTNPYQRKEIQVLLDRLSEPPHTLIFIAGPRQVGKTTLVRDALTQYKQDQYSFVPIDRPDDIDSFGFVPTKSEFHEQAGRPRDTAWLINQWQRARAAARASLAGHILILDEIQKITRWSETIKGLWDADRAESLKLHVFC